MTDLDDTDRRLLALLAAEARAPVAQLAKRLKMARTTVQARLERLERSGVIAGYTVRLSEAAQARMIRATVLVSLVPVAQANVLAGLARMAEVERVHTTSGRFDLAVQIGTGSTVALDDALDRIAELEGIRDIESLIHLTTRIDRLA